jgi:hypothetical protein
MTDSQEKIEISAKTGIFHAISSSFSALSSSLFPTNQNGQAAYAAPQAPHKPFVCLRVPSCPFVPSPLRVPLWFKGFSVGVLFGHFDTSGFADH